MCDEIDVWIGTSGTAGIYHVILDTKKGKLSAPILAAKVNGAGFLARHPNGGFLYSTAKEDGEGGVAAFRIKRNQNTKKQLLLAKARDRELLESFGAPEPVKKHSQQIANLAAAPVLEKLNFLPKRQGLDPAIDYLEATRFLRIRVFQHGFELPRPRLIVLDAVTERVRITQRQNSQLIAIFFESNFTVAYSERICRDSCAIMETGLIRF